MNNGTESRRLPAADERRAEGKPCPSPVGRFDVLSEGIEAREESGELLTTAGSFDSIEVSRTVGDAVEDDSRSFVLSGDFKRGDPLSGQGNDDSSSLLICSASDTRLGEEFQRDAVEAPHADDNFLTT